MPQIAYAHGLNYGVIKTSLRGADSTLTLHTSLTQHIDIGASDRNGQRKLLEQYFQKTFLVSSDDKLCTFHLDTFDNSSQSSSTYDGHFSCPFSLDTISELRIYSTLFGDSLQAFDHFVTLDYGNKKFDTVFRPDTLDHSFQLRARSSVSKQALPTDHLGLTAQFIKMGVEHIWTGYDHILFLLVAILLLRSVKKIVIVVTSFTIAHSLTLVLAGLGIVTVSPHIVEPLIALTIAIVAVRNLILLNQNKSKSDHLSERWILTASFGLIHGLGFAGALKEVGIPKDYFVPSLLFFNVGVEVGQLCILLVVIPILFLIDRLEMGKRLQILAMIFAIFAALMWFLERISS